MDFFSNLAQHLAQNLGMDKNNLFFCDSVLAKENVQQNSSFSQSYFEVASFLNQNQKNVQLTIDEQLTEKIRDIGFEVLRHVNLTNNSCIENLDFIEING